MEKAPRKKILQGIIVSDKSDKTAIIKVDTFVKHPLYNKRERKSKKYAFHDEKNECSMGDVVSIIESRPLSATKRFRLLKIVEKKENI